MGQGVLSAGFARRAGALKCEGVPLVAIAEAAGTPSYVYSVSTIRNRYELLAETLAPVPHRIHYTLKANSNRAILRLVRSLGAGADVVSGGELTVTIHDPDGRDLSRSVAAPGRADEVPEVTALLVGNLARDEASGLLARLRQPEPASERPRGARDAA